MSSLTMLDAIKETERIGKEYTDRKVQEATGNGGGGSAGNYPPYSGIPRDDLSRDVRSSLEKADSALQPGDAETTYQPKGDYPTKTEMSAAIAAAQMGDGSGAPVNATAIKYTPEGGEETTVAAALTLLSEEKDKLAGRVQTLENRPSGSGMSQNLIDAFVDYIAHAIPNFDDPNGMTYRNNLLIALGANVDIPDTPTYDPVSVAWSGYTATVNNLKNLTVSYSGTVATVGGA